MLFQLGLRKYLYLKLFPDLASFLLQPAQEQIILTKIT